MEKRNSSLLRIRETHRAYDNPQYPLIFWDGQYGYNLQIPQTNPITGAHILGKKVSSIEFYAYHFILRKDSYYTIQRCRNLFHQFVVDMYAKTETERLLFIRLNQRKLREDDYIHHRDAIAVDGTASNLGKLVILPSSFIGSPRYMHERTQDAMTYVRNYRRPDLFITFTYNPLWSEITTSLLPRQKPHDRHDIIARVFRLKIVKLMELLTKGAVLSLSHVLS